jgi:formylglycine-generating enzyme required for sulfatase activity
MVSLAGGTITGSGSDGAFIGGRTVTLSAFKIARYETTYELWKEVRDWATDSARGANVYTINVGWEGHQETGTSPGAGTTNELTHGWTAAEKKSRPVTRINWRDAVVWCNAYSEMSGRDPVYYTDTTYTTVLRVSTDNSGTGTAADGAKMKPGANGYRLPTEAEWEYAARGGNPVAPEWGYIYAGQAGNTTYETETSQPLTQGDPGPYLVAWFRDNADEINQGSSNATNKHYGVHPVGTKAANSKDLYDMSGNVCEWCWDWSVVIDPMAVTNPAGPATGSYRVVRGGGWNGGASDCALSWRSDGSPNFRISDLGFRVACP